jgi:hypothetical protein
VRGEKSWRKNLLLGLDRTQMYGSFPFFVPLWTHQIATNISLESSKRQWQFIK